METDTQGSGCFPGWGGEGREGTWSSPSFPDYQAMHVSRRCVLLHSQPWKLLAPLQREYMHEVGHPAGSYAMTKPPSLGPIFFPLSRLHLGTEMWKSGCCLWQKRGNPGDRI